MTRILVLQDEFSSAHLYHNKSLSQAENKENFGRCFTKYGHGHNYKISIGFVINPKLSQDNLENLNKILKVKLKKLTSVLDHEHLNFVVPEFKTTIPTTENILLYFEKSFLDLKLKNDLAFIKLFESENLWSQKYYVTQ